MQQIGLNSYCCIEITLLVELRWFTSLLPVYTFSTRRRTEHTRVIVTMNQFHLARPSPKPNIRLPRGHSSRWVLVLRKLRTMSAVVLAPLGLQIFGTCAVESDARHLNVYNHRAGLNTAEADDAEVGRDL